MLPIEKFCPLKFLSADFSVGRKYCPPKNFPAKIIPTRYLISKTLSSPFSTGEIQAWHERPVEERLDNVRQGARSDGSNHETISVPERGLYRQRSHHQSLQS